ncbi:relaxase/mobilization nuclease domain-containing protein [Myroides sp.]|jgi:hypothetical protein|uniref:relaxase/mobilization nuclease domain-containing protein n=1 Tax=Myroides sp. TaxID=1874736 RepID=UPI0028ACC395|nr:relaxase/mobilization nuclease domain-containing protein [Myroides sp.]
MISKAKSVRGSSQAIDYILNDKGQAIELDRNGLVGKDGKEILQELRMVQSENQNCKNNTISIVLSPDADQGKLSNKELRKALHEHLENLGLIDHQWIATVHNSTQNQHIHIIANRIDFNAKALNDSFISKKSQESAEKIAQNMGLKTAKQIEQSKKTETKGLKKEIEKSILECKAKSNNFDDFCRLMKSNGYDVKPTYNKQGVLFGMRIDNGDNSFKLSEINRNIKHYHFADILPQETKLKAPELVNKVKSSSNSSNLIVNAIKSQLGEEINDVFKAVDIASSINPSKLAINALKVSIKDVGRSMSL